MSFQGIVFDLDGTLYDFKGLPLKMIASSPFNIFRFGADRKTRKILKGKDFTDSAGFYKCYSETFAALRGISPSNALDWYQNYFGPQTAKIFKKHYKLRPQVEELFKSLKARGIKVAVFSDYPRVQERLEALGFHFENASTPDLMISAEELGGLKPCKRLFSEVVQKLGLAPEQTLMVGDRLDTDGAGATSIAMPFIQIATHKNKPKDQKTLSHPYLFWDEFLEQFLKL